MQEGDLSDFRNDYRLGSLDDKGMEADPVSQFRLWIKEAIDMGVTEPTAMTLATADRSGKPSARMVLLKGFDHDGFVFFTNYLSRKGEDISANPHVALVLYWKELERQVRIEGLAGKVSAEESEEYFASRPVDSQVSAIVSPQSSVVPNRQHLETLKRQYLENQPGNHRRPDHWGGYRVAPGIVEFWQGRPERLHDRIRYTRQKDGWKTERLAP